MNRATLVYFFMALALVAGLSAILGFGSGLRAPPDLSGTWQIEPEARPATRPSTQPATAPAGPTRLGRSMVLEQSGRFVRLRFEQGPTVDLKMVGEKRAVVGGRYVHSIEFAGRGWALSAEGDPALEVMRMDLLGPVSVALIARRTQRTYPASANR